MQQREDQERVKEANRKLEQRLDKVGSPPTLLRQKNSRRIMAIVLLVLVALVVFFWMRKPDAPSAGGTKAYPDQNGNLRKPGTQ